MKTLKKEEKYKYCTDAIQLKNDLESGFILLGEQLSKIKNEGLWETAWTSWSEYVKELKMSENHVNKLIQIFEKLVLGLKVPKDQIANAGGWSIVSDLLPIIESKKDAEEWLEKAATLTREDLRSEMKEQKTGVLMHACKHKNIYTIVVCRDCGLKMEDHEDHDH